MLRRSRQPQVSGLVVGSLATMAASSILQRILVAVIISAAQKSGRGIASVSLVLSIIGLAAAVIRLGAWIAMLTALFGWRDAAATGPSRATLQFSIFSLMAVTLVVAILCGAVRALVVWLGESAEILISLVDEAPLLICWVVGIRIAIARWSIFAWRV